MKKGLVVKKNANLFFVGDLPCVARGNLKERGIFVGDRVEYDDRTQTIEKVLPRRNLLIRPPIANLERMFIVIAPTPKPDFYLVDKLILFCQINDIKPILVVNKTDILKKELKDFIQNTYSHLLPIVCVSAQEGEVNAIKTEVKGICAFAGQSAVGKSSLINALFDEEREKVGQLSRKTDRGKQTTRLVSLHHLGGKNYLADTAGFSKLDERLLGVQEREVGRFFADFVPYLGECEYNSCCHIAEKKCGVKQALKVGKISEQRYNSYVKIFQTLKNMRRVK